MNNFHREEYFGCTVGASCSVPHDGHRKYDHMEFRYYFVRVEKDWETGFRLGYAETLGVPYEDAKKALGIK